MPSSPKRTEPIFGCSLWDAVVCNKLAENSRRVACPRPRPRWLDSSSQNTSCPPRALPHNRRRHKQRPARRHDGLRSCGIPYVFISPERRPLAFVSVLAKRFKDRDVIASRRNGGHTPGTCKGGDRTTGALAQTGQGNQSALHSRYHRKGTDASLWSQDRRAHASNIPPKPTRAAQQGSANCSCGSS